MLAQCVDSREGQSHVDSVKINYSRAGFRLGPTAEKRLNIWIVSTTFFLHHLILSDATKPTCTRVTGPSACKPEWVERKKSMAAACMFYAKKN